MLARDSKLVLFQHSCATTVHGASSCSQCTLAGWGRRTHGTGCRAESAETMGYRCHEPMDPMALCCASHRRIQVHDPTLCAPHYCFSAHVAADVSAAPSSTARNSRTRSRSAPAAPTDSMPQHRTTHVGELYFSCAPLGAYALSCCAHVDVCAATCVSPRPALRPAHRPDAPHTGLVYICDGAAQCLHALVAAALALCACREFCTDLGLPAPRTAHDYTPHTAL